MQNVIVGSLLFLCSLPVVGGGMRIASDLRSQSLPPVILDVHEEPLWTTQVKRVDPNQQAYERLPSDVDDALLASNDVPRSKPSIQDSGLPLGKATDIDVAEHKSDEWCARKYRSYVKADKSYQPFSGGPRRRCVPPIDLVETEKRPQIASLNDDHVAWCMSRYRSYQPEDNSYQPFSGPRRQCQSGLEASDQHYRTTLLAQQVSN